VTRRGLVLGGGGVLGGAWMVGALSALEAHLGTDLREVDQLVGTSAGSVVGALLAAGVGVPDLRAHQLGEPTSGPLAGFSWNYEKATGGGRPPRPRAGPGSAGLIARNVGHLRRLPPTAVLSALLPEGRGSLESVGALVRHVVPSGWAPRDGLQVVTMDFRTGRRVAFGRPGSPEADLADAVMASCAIPGWYSPVTIGEGRYVDGGACSSTSVDLLTDAKLDEVYVIAPSVSFAMDHPAAFLTRLERQWRVRVTRRCLREVAKLHAAGTEVVVVGPGPEDLAVIGGNLMDVGRRRQVLETSLRTSAEALADPEPLDALPARVDRSGVLHDPDDERPSEQAPPAEEPAPAVPVRTRQERQ
jgi:NTE family protein